MKDITFVGPDALTAVTVKDAVVYDVTPYSPV
jgi:hypothetical protein